MKLGLRLTELVGRTRAASRTRASRRKIETQIRSGFNDSHGFLHIGKTGGTGIQDLRQKLLDRGYRPPVLFGHEWTLSEILRCFPGIKIAVFIRDPLERIVSGFNSRLREGRPRRNNPWTSEEAIAFSYFADPLDYLRALIGRDERLMSAACFTTRHVSHIRRGYVFHFGSAALVSGRLDSIYAIGRTEAMTEALEAMFVPCGVPASILGELYQKAHVSPVGTRQVLDGLDEAEKQAARRFFSQEYEIYRVLNRAVSGAGPESIVPDLGGAEHLDTAH